MLEKDTRALRLHRKRLTCYLIEQAEEGQCVKLYVRLEGTAGAEQSKYWNNRMAFLDRKQEHEVENREQRVRNNMNERKKYPA